MNSWFYFLYNAIAIPAMQFGFSLAIPFNSKIRTGWKGRKHLYTELETVLKQHQGKAPRIWIHNSSMGEFEQAKPVIAAIKKRNPSSFILVSFFSPSGYEHAKTYQEADYLCYLPFDSRKNAKKFIETIAPDVAVVVRHDFWPNHLWTLREMNIPAILINCSIGDGWRFRIRFLKRIERSLYQCFDHIFAVSQIAKERCERNHFNRGQVSVIGDTRYDQVVARAEAKHDLVRHLIERKGNRVCLVLGSTWPGDESVIFTALERIDRTQYPLWLIVVPHEPTLEHLHKIENRLEAQGRTYKRLSEVKSADTQPLDAIVVDSVGVLANLYALSDIAYVGGGFGVGVHSVLEPAAFGRIVIYGPHHRNSYEAIEMKEAGIGFSVENADELYVLLFSLLEDQKQLSRLGEKAKKMVEQNLGATQKITSFLCGLVEPPK